MQYYIDFFWCKQYPLTHSKVNCLVCKYSNKQLVNDAFFIQNKKKKNKQSFNCQLYLAELTTFAKQWYSYEKH